MSGTASVASTEREQLHEDDSQQPRRRTVTWSLSEECIQAVEHEAVDRHSYPRTIIEQIIRQALIWPKRNT